MLNKIFEGRRKMAESKKHKAWLFLEYLNTTYCMTSCDEFHDIFKSFIKINMIDYLQKKNLQIQNVQM